MKRFRWRINGVSFSTLVLLDLTMPGLSGGDTLRELFAINPNVRVIISSGHDEVEAARRIGDDVHVEYMQKPYTFDALLAMTLGSSEPLAG